MRVRAALVPLLAAALYACGPAPDDVRPEWRPDPSLQEVPAGDTAIALTDAARATVDEIRNRIGGDSLRPLARFADSQTGFRSNFGGARHFEHWYVLRRTGVDPLAELGRLLDQPVGRIQVGAEVWFVWPDLAALPADALVDGTLAPKDRVRLHELVGEEGLARIRDGSPYPGFRTAISSTGRWIYYLHETGEPGDK